MKNPAINNPQGILLIDKPSGKTSFSLVSRLRKLLNVQKIGHAGTLDPLATGLMIMLIGKNFTRKSDQFLLQDKEYVAEISFGTATDSYDSEGTVVSSSDIVPSEIEIDRALSHFQGEIEQTPPMFSAKKINGKKLYELARKGVVVPRKSVKVNVQIEKLSYHYPKLLIKVACSKGTYIRTLAHDIGVMIGCGAHLSALKRTRSGSFKVEDCFKGDLFQTTELDVNRLKESLIFDHADLQKSN